MARLHEQPVTVTGQSLMTYEYAAPEQFDNPRQVDETADYYALGVVLYECLTGKVPFAMRDEGGLVTFMNTVLTTIPPSPELPSGQPVPSSLATLLQQLLAKKPAERMHNPGAVKLALKQAEVEQLHQEQTPAVMPTPARTQTYQTDKQAVVVPRPASSPPNQSAVGSSQPLPRPNRRLLPIVLLAGVVLLSAFGLYRFFIRTNEPLPTAQSTTKTIPTIQTTTPNRPRMLSNRPNWPGNGIRCR